jgi:transglutaminase-like putative cysteine protease
MKLRLIFFILLFNLVTITTLAQQKTLAPGEFAQWLPITAEEMQQKAPRVEKDAGAEVLMWRVHVVDEILSDGALQRVMYHYVRVKIFNDKGKDQASTIDLTYGDRGNIMAVSGRTTKADGSVIELPKNAVYKRDVVKAGGFKQKAISFAMPAVEPGAIIDYRWRQSQDDGRFRYIQLRFQREYPVQKATYFVKPLDSFRVGAQMYLMPFNCKPSPIKPENDGYMSTSVENIPAGRFEPYAPSELTISPWALLYYAENQPKNTDKFWQDLGKKEYQDLKQSLKADDALKQAAAKATADAKSEEEKVLALIGYLREHLRDVFSTSVTDAERNKWAASLPKDRSHRTSTEIMKSGLGSPNELNIVFAAMAAQAGLDARPALVHDHVGAPFDPRVMTDSYFLDAVDMAVRIGETWKVYDVSQRYLPGNMLSWREEGEFALITDPKTPTFQRTPMSAPEASNEGRSAKFELSGDGELAGDVKETLTGHKAEEYRREVKDEPQATREDKLKERLAAMFPRSEVTEIKILNVEDTRQPVEIRYHLQAPYAQVTGKRILFEPFVFHRGEASPFSGSERRHPLDFRYAWSESDDVTIRLPNGYQLDNGESPGSINFGATGGYNVKLTVNKTTNELLITRNLTFGAKEQTLYGAKDYPQVKKIFDEYHSRDRHTLSIREAQ